MRPRPTLACAAALAAALLVAERGTASAQPGEKPLDEAKKLLDSGTLANRQHALEILEGLAGDKSAEKLVISALDDEDWGVGMQAADVLSRTGGDAARDALADAAVTGEIQWVRDAAARALGTLAGAEAGELLLDQTKRHKEETVKARAVDGAAAYVGPEHVSRLARFALDKDPYLARSAARALGGLAADGRAGAEALKAIGPVLSKRKDTRSFLPYSGAIEGLARAAPDSSAVIATLLDEVVDAIDDDGYVPERVARGLAAAGGAKVAAPFHAAVEASRKRAEVRRLALLAARLGLPELREDVASLLTHKEERVRSAAALALGRIGAPESRDALLAALDDKGAFVRVEAVAALARVLPRAEFAALGERLRGDRDERVRLQYVVELYDTLDPVGLEPLTPYVKDDSWRVATAAAATIGALGVAEDLPRLKPLLDTKDWKLRAAAYEGLGRLRAKEAVPLLAEGLADRDPVVRGVCWTNLQILTSERLPAEQATWLEWWRANGDALSIRKRSRRTKEEIAAEEEKNGRYAPETRTRDQSVEILQKARILVVTGAWDKVEKVLEHLTIKHTLLRAQQIKLAGLSPNQILLVNCEGNLDSDSMERVAWFVNVGGYAMTTDWALTKTIMPVFPGYATQYARSSTGNDVVVVEQGLPAHPLTAGVFDGVPALQWWLEVQAFPLTVLYPERVDVIVDSAEMRHRYGSSPLGIAFRWGLGKVQHSASHFYLQEEGMQNAREPRARMVFAADNLGLSLETIRRMEATGAFDGRLTEKTMTEIAPDYSMFRLIVNMVKEKSDWVEGL